MVVIMIMVHQCQTNVIIELWLGLYVDGGNSMYYGPRRLRPIEYGPRQKFAYFITIDIQQTDKLLTVQMRTLIMYC